MDYKTIIILLPWLFTLCLCEISEDTKEKLLSDFVTYFNYQPNQNVKAREGFLQSVTKIDKNIYNIEVTFTVQRDHGPKLMKCTATVQDLGEHGIAIVNNIKQCADIEQASHDSAESVEDQADRKSARHENNDQGDPTITPSEQFIAIPRNQLGGTCLGCASRINPQAAGVEDLANLGIRHLDFHEPNVKHSLDLVLDVERQVQVLSGVRYILMLSINFNNCTDVVTNFCSFLRTCKITILVKPWQILPSGAKYQAVLGNNCTKGIHIGNNGEVLRESTGNQENDEKNAYFNDDIEDEKHQNVQYMKKEKKNTLSARDMKTLEEQIIPHDHSQDYYKRNQEADTFFSYDESNKHVTKTESSQQYNDNSLVVTKSANREGSHLNRDKKKVIDEMLDFLSFSGFKPKTHDEDVIPRVKRNYDYDLQILSLTEDFHDLKKSIENAKYVYEMAQAMVDYLNEMDMEVKNRAVKNVIKAEEEEDNDKKFVYIQAQVVIPCDTANCEPKETETKICNGVIDSTNKKSPQILNTFCYIDMKEMDTLDKVREVPLDDRVLLRLAKEALRKIELEAVDPHALKIKKIVYANTRVASGRLTKISMIIEHVNCNKSVPLVLRNNCTTLEYLGSSICEVIVHERHWLKERKIIYTCTERPVDMTINKFKQNAINITVDDPKIIEILQEALQYLEMQSNKKNKQKIVNVNKIYTQIIAGFLTKIEFIVGYTNCTDSNDLKSQSSKCELLKNELLRRCKAQIWDRSWIVDGRQMEVTCDEDSKISNEFERSTRQKRSLDFAGGQMKQNVAKPEYKKLAEESLKRYLQKISSQQHYNILSIDRATVREASGKITRIEFTISPTDCQIKSDGTPSSSQCNVVNLENTISCHSTILNQGWASNKQYSVSCKIGSQKLNVKKKTSTKDKEISNQQKCYHFAEESLKKYLEDTGNLQSYKIVRVENFTYQGDCMAVDFLISTVYNSNGVNIKCHSEILEKHWPHTKDLNVTCQIHEIKNESHDVMRQVSDNPKYMLMAVEPLQFYLKTRGDSHLVRVAFINKVYREDGITKISFIASKSDDSEGDTICYAYFNEETLLDVKCFEIGQIVGKDITLKDPKDFKYIELAEESLHKYIRSINTSLFYTIVEIEKVSVQWIEEELNTKIIFIVSSVDFDSNNLQGKRCVSEIRAQQWLNKTNIHVTCEEDQDLYRAKRQILGSFESQNTSSPKYKTLAEESLQKYLKETGNTQAHTVLEIDKVTTQIADGSMTRINFVASPINSARSDVITCFSQIWEHSRLNNKKDIKVSCQIRQQRSKRHAGGREREEDPNDPKYLLLADESLQKYLVDSANNLPHRVVRIEKATTQVVAGLITRIYFIAKPTDSISGDFIITCFTKIWEQSWLDKKQIDVFCRRSNQILENQVPGAELEQDPNYPKYQQLADESLQKYLLDTRNARPHKIVRIDKVTSQVVSGSMTKINFVAIPTDSAGDGVITCVSKIWEQSWLNKKQIEVSCRSDLQIMEYQMMGSEIEQDPNDPKYMQLADESLQKHLGDTGNPRLHTVVRIDKVTTQTVNGLIIRINFIATPSDSVSGESLSCISKIWEQSWLNKKQIDISCHSGSQKLVVPRPGSEVEQNPNDPKYLPLAYESLQQYLTDSGNTRPHTVVRIDRVTSQMVSGYMTRINFVATSIENTADILICFSKIWEQSWLNRKQIEVSCRIGNQKLDSQSYGSEIEHEPKDPKYLQLANESLQKYLSDAGNTRPHKVMQIEKVSSQVVSGLITRIKFVAVPIDGDIGDTLACFTKIWEQSWANKKQIDVSCRSGNQRMEGQVFGRDVEKDPNDPKYLLLANESLLKYLSESGDPRPHRVVRIDKVTSKVVAGSMTKINFVAVPTDSSSGTIACYSKIWEQSWLNKKEIDVSCRSGYQRMEIQAPGGTIDQDPNNLKYLKLADESLQKYLADTGNPQPHRVLRIDKVTSQVVTGLITSIDFIAISTESTSSDIITCFSKIWEQSWLKKKQIDVSCHTGNQAIDTQAPDSEVEQDPSNLKYLQLADESLQKYLSESSNTRPYRVVRIDRVTSQVLAGSVIRINFEATPTDSIGGEMINCFSKILEQPWLSKNQIEVFCRTVKQKLGSQVISGQEDKDPTDLKYFMLANESLQKYLRDSGNLRPYRVVQIDKVSSEVSAGSMTIINFAAVPSDSASDDKITCFAKIWEQSWINKNKIDVSCQNSIQRFKRYILDSNSRNKYHDMSKHKMLGRLIIEDVNDPKYKILAEESLQKYLSNTSNVLPYKLVTIDKVTTQFDSGLITSINFTVSLTNSTSSDITTCFSKIWEQSWHKKDINVSCQNISRRIKRSAVIRHEEDPEDPKFVGMAYKAMTIYLDQIKDVRRYTVVKIYRASVEEYSGDLFRIFFVIRPEEEEDSYLTICYSKIWRRPWIGEDDYTVTCALDTEDDRRKRRKRKSPDPILEKTATTPKYLQLANESLQKYLTDTGNPRSHIVMRIDKAISQVQGLLSKINFVALANDSAYENIINCFSEIWEQPWLDKKDINVSCKNYSNVDVGLNIVKKEQKENALVEQDPKDPKYLELAIESLKAYVSESGNQQQLDVVSVEKVTTQVISGTLIRLSFIVLPTNTSNSDIIKCYSEVLEQLPQHDKRKFKVSCQVDHPRLKGQVLNPIIEEDPNDPKYFQLAEESLQKYLKDSGDSKPHKVIRVEQVTTKLATGFETRINFVVTPILKNNTIINCFSEILEKPFLSKKEFKVICDNNDRISIDNRNMRHKIDLNNQNNDEKNIEEEQDVSKPEYHLLASQSLRKFSKKVGVLHKLFEIEHVTRRVSSGIIYNIDFSATPTDCIFNVSNVREKACRIMTNTTVYCHAEIWEQALTRQRQISIKCDNLDGVDYQHVSGEEDTEDKDKLPTFKVQLAQRIQNSKVDALANEASNYYLTTSNIQNMHRITGINNFYEHLVDGIVSTIEFSMSPTICLRNESIDSIERCEFKIPKINLLCRAQIKERPWLKNEKDFKVSCNELTNYKNKKRSKREIDAEHVDEEENEIDEDTTYYYADRAVQHVNERTDANNLFKLITIHAIQTSVQMKTIVVKMYIEIAETYCLRHQSEVNLYNCEEMEGLNHRLCLARVYPSPDDELVVRHVSVVCDDNDMEFNSVTGLNIPELLRLSIETLERKPENHFKLVHQGEPQVIPSLEAKSPIKLNFVIAITNCTKDVDLNKNPFQCYLDTTIPSRSCYSYIWLETKSRTVHYIDARCNDDSSRQKRALLDTNNVTTDSVEIKELVTAALEKLEMASLHRYKQRVLHINSHSTKITSGKVTTIDFDVGYTSCLKYEWVDNVTSCDFLEHLPRRHCVAQIWERLWLKNGRNIDVSCEDDETPLEAHIEFESAEMAMQLAQEALKHIEAKYPHPKKQKIVRIFSLEKQAVAGIHYRMKVEVGFTDCAALSEQTDCKLENNLMLNKFCRVNVWVRPWTDHPPNFRVSCDFQEGSTTDLYHQVQSEQLFYNFLATYNPSYVNDHSELERRFDIFKDNIKKIHELNVHEKGTAIYGVTRFTDLTYKEFRSHYMGLNLSLANDTGFPIKNADIPTVKLPLSFDWRDFDAVTEVKDQGSCGSSWAFSVTGNIEGQWKMQSGQLVSLSEQELLDCDEINNGCGGGTPPNAYRVIEQLGGLESEIDYPYEAESDKCLFNKTQAKVQITGAVNITSNETGMAQWLVHNGPISIGINANAMQFYMSGISHPWQTFCSRTNLDHSMLIVGYGVQEYPVFHKKVPYWIVKNSWGTSWGEQGYFRVYRGDGTCGINKMATSAVI